MARHFFWVLLLTAHLCSCFESPKTANKPEPDDSSNPNPTAATVPPVSAAKVEPLETIQSEVSPVPQSPAADSGADQEISSQLEELRAELARLKSAPAAPEVKATQEKQPEPAKASPTPIDFSQFQKHLFTVTGSEGDGSGFIAALDGKPVAVTNCHNLSGNTSIRFVGVNSTNIEISPTLNIIRNRDVAMLPVVNGEGGLDLMDDVSAHVSPGDEIFVLGNSMGKGVVTVIAGKILGIGPELIEVDAEFVSGNSGSPIIHKKTNKVIGIATYTTTETKLDLIARDKNTPFSETRWFGYRLDLRGDLESLTPAAFAASGALVKARDELTQRLILFFGDVVSDSSINNESRYTGPRDNLSRAVSEFIAKRNRGALSTPELVKARTSLIREVQAVCKSDFVDPAFRNHSFDSWHLGEIKRIQEIRKQLLEQFDILETKFQDRGF